MRSLVAAFGLTLLVLFVVVVLARQETVTGSVPVVAHAASARCGLTSNAGRASIETVTSAGECFNAAALKSFRIEDSPYAPMRTFVSVGHARTFRSCPHARPL